MSSKYKFRDQDDLYFVTFSVVNWIDLFIRNEYKEIMLESWTHCQENKGLEIYAWCIMTSHIHMVIGTHGSKLEEIMRDMKKYTSITLKKAIQTHPGESRREWLLWMMEQHKRST
jgi:REP element-mobilizing transposase RayT